MKKEALKSGIVIFITALVLIVMTVPGYGQQDSVWVWYGDPDTIDVSIGQRVYLDFYVQTPETVWIADCHFCMGAQDQYIDSLLSHVDGVYYYPFTEWQVAAFLEPQDSVEYPEPMPEGWTSQSFVGIATYYEPRPWLHFETPTRVLTWVLHTANDSTNIGDDARAIGDEGRNYPQGPTNIGDTLGGAGYIPVESFAIFHFTGGGYIDGVITDAESDPIESVSIVNNLTGKETFSDENGEYHMGLYPGIHALTFSHPDYIEHTVENIVIVEDQTNQIDVTLNQPGAITGVVTNNDGENISGVIVATDTGVNDTTGNDGIYYLGDLEAGLYDVSFSHANYVDTTVLDVEAQLNQETILDITLHQLGGIRGAVTNIANGEPIEGVYVLIVDTNHDDTTNASGLYSFSQIEPGLYEISFSHPDYFDTVIADVEVNYDDTTMLDVEMRTPTGINDNIAAIPEAYSLNQNYPNPFNTSTCIKYGLPEDTHVIIEIYDLLGRRIEALVNEYQTAGYHQANWNADGLTSGMYFYIIRANDFVEKKSMILLK